MRHVLPLVILLLLTAPAVGAMTISHHALPPTGDGILLGLDDATADDGHDWTHGTGMAVDVGQTFRFTAPVTLDRVTFRIRAETSIGGEFVTLRLGTYTDATDAAMNELLWAESAPLPPDLPIGTARYVTFTLGRPVQLAADRQLGVVIGFTGGGGVDDARGEILHLGGDLYPGGQAVTELGSFFESHPEDLVLYLQGEDDSIEPPPLPDPEEQLLLQAGRFRIEAFWRTPFGTEGYGQAIPLTSETGCFWFFGEGNMELFVKVLDACTISDRYWVFVAGLTNVEVRIEVHDDLAGVSNTYTNPMGQSFLPIFDTAFFATCP